VVPIDLLVKGLGIERSGGAGANANENFIYPLHCGRGCVVP